MSKRTRRQRRKQRTTPQQPIESKKSKRRGLPSLQETEDYIREHNLEVINPLSDFGFKRLLASERNRLLYMFTNVVYLPKKEINNLTPMQLRFYKECQITNFTDMEKQDYVKSLMEHDDVREMVKCERDEAKEEGIQIGIGLGIEQGIVQGRIERDRQIVLGLLENGFDITTIEKVTGVSEVEILAMKK